MSVTLDDRSPVVVDQEALDRVRELYSEGDILGSYEVARPFGPLDRWAGTAARVLGGRLARHMGASRLCSALHARA
jgi:hypothetical protein